VFCHLDWVLRAIKCGFYHTDRGLRAIECVFFHTDWGGPVDLKPKSPRGPSGFGDALWALGGRGVNSQLDSQIEDL
jgi:hypothetical protein